MKDVIAYMLKITRVSRSKLLLSALAVAMLSTLAGQSYAAPTEPYGLYTDKAAWDAKVKEAKTLHGKQATGELTDAQKRDQKAMEEAFDKVSPSDLQALDKLAKKYKVVVYRPLEAKKEHHLNKTTGDVGAMSTESDLTMDVPYVTYSPTTNQVGINAHTKWDNLNTVIDDSTWGYGGPDSMTMIINGISTKTAVKSQSLRTYKTDGTQGVYSTSLFSTPLQSRVWPVTMRFQESGSSTNSYNAAEISMWVYTYGLTSPVEATAIYEHNWRSVQLKSITFSTSTQLENQTDPNKYWHWGLDLGLTWTWDFGSEHWPLESNTISF